MSEVKTCSRCGETKPAEEFCAGKNRKGQRIYLNKCLACERERSRKKRSKPGYAEVEREKNRLAAARRIATDAEYRKRKNRANADREKAKRDSDPSYKKAVRELQKRLYATDPEFKNRTDEYNLNWRKENPEKARAIRKRANKKTYQRRRSTVRGTLEMAISAGVRRCIAGGTKAGRKTFDLLGYTVDELRTHLERQFQPGMTWDNYGKGGWEIDHIIPLSVHNYETPDDIDFKRAWALSNLQPLWASVNRNKSDRLFKPFQPSLRLAVTDNQPNLFSEAA